MSCLYAGGTNTCFVATRNRCAYVHAGIRAHAKIQRQQICMFVVLTFSLQQTLFVAIMFVCISASLHADIHTNIVACTGTRKQHSCRFVANKNAGMLSLLSLVINSICCTALQRWYNSVQKNMNRTRRFVVFAFSRNKQYLLHSLQ